MTRMANRMMDSGGVHASTIGDDVPKPAFPPAGFVDRDDAAALLGISRGTLDLWVRKGRMSYTGMLAKGPNGVKIRIYAVAELEQAMTQIRAADTADAALPDGLVDRDGAAAFFGVGVYTIDKWQTERRLRCGRWFKLPSGQRRRVFALADLERVRAGWEAEAARPTAPEGFVELHEVTRMLGISAGTLAKWDRAGRVGPGRVTPIPGTSARTKIYPLAEIERLREELREAAANFPPQGWIRLEEAADRATVSVLVWKRWMAEGRVDGGRWVKKPRRGRCKLFRIEEVDRVIAEAGRDHLFFMEPDGQGGWCPPAGYVCRAEAAAIFDVAESTFVHWQSDGRITCGRWARMPVGEAGLADGAGGRRVYPVEELRRLAEEFGKVGQPYIDPADPSIARVPVMSWSHTRFEAIIDAADLPLIEGMRWNWMPRGDDSDGGATAVVARSAPSGGQTPLRQILLKKRGRRWRYSHRNGDPLDCRRDNIVVKTAGEKNHGHRKRRTHGGRPCTSRFKGVCWHEKRGKWVAGIQKEGVGYKLGAFDDEMAAAEAYDEAARELYGEYARVNFPDGVDAWLARDLAARAADENAEDEHLSFGGADTWSCAA